MRSKEESHDYRYMPEPDLGPLRIDLARIERIRAGLPELPEALAKRYQEQMGLTSYDAGILTSDRDLAAFFETVLNETHSKVTPKIVANWVIGEFLREVNARGWTFTSPPLSAKALGDLLVLLAEDTISGKIAKTIFQTMAETGEAPREIMNRMGLVQVSDESAILDVINRVLGANPDQLAQYRSGKDKLFGFFVGQVMREGQGKLSPSLVNKLLKDALDGKTS
jgi:aspartyl-tRNA(Asn)/glutamyl-tRNA(Gln) amidotransferase subunit B